jgi:hypothetical protein
MNPIAAVKSAAADNGQYIARRFPERLPCFENSGKTVCTSLSALHLIP